VQWENKNGETREGMYIPHRDTSSRLGSLLGGTLLPGHYAHARFTVYESFDELFVEMRTRRKEAPSLVVQGRIAAQMPHDSVFNNITEASDFFAYHSDEKSEGASPEEFGGMKLRRRNWQLIPMEITCMRSAYFDDTSRFSVGGIRFDSGLLLRGTATEWVKETCLASAKEMALPAG
jgi:hypothetical protein